MGIPLLFLAFIAVAWIGHDPGHNKYWILTRFVLALAEVILVLDTPGELMTRSKGVYRSACHSSVFTA